MSDDVIKAAQRALDAKLQKARQAQDAAAVAKYQADNVYSPTFGANMPHTVYDEFDADEANEARAKRKSYIRQWEQTRARSK